MSDFNNRAWIAPPPPKGFFSKIFEVYKKYKIGYNSDMKRHYYFCKKFVFTLAEVFNPAAKHRKFPFTLAEAFNPAAKSRKFAFTLAEVLITLGIIGIVAALTMPGLISHHKKQEIESKLAKFYSNVNQAIKYSEIENGPKEHWDYSLNSQDFYDEYLDKYLKTVKKIKHTDNRFMTVYFADGSKATIGYNKCFNLYTSKKQIDLYAPIGCANFTTENERFKYGKDIFSFQICRTNLGIEPTEEACNHILPNHVPLGYEAVFNNCKNPALGNMCTELIRRNGWKIPNDYPIKI